MGIIIDLSSFAYIEYTCIQAKVLENVCCIHVQEYIVRECLLSAELLKQL